MKILKETIRDKFDRDCYRFIVNKNNLLRFIDFSLFFSGEFCIGYLRYHNNWIHLSYKNHQIFMKNAIIPHFIIKNDNSLKNSI